MLFPYLGHIVSLVFSDGFWREIARVQLDSILGRYMTLWVLIYVDMPGTFFSAMTNSGTLIYVLAPSYNHEDQYWVNHLYSSIASHITCRYFASLEGKHFRLPSLLGVHFYSYRNIDVHMIKNFDHLSGQTMMNTILHEWPRVYLLHRQE